MNRQQSLIAKLLQQQHTKKYAEGGSAGARGRRDQVATDTGWDPSSMGQKLADVGKYTLNQVTTPLETVTGWEFYDPSFSETKFGSTTGKISKVNEGLTSIATDVAGTALLGPGYAAGKAALTAGFDAAGAKDVNSGQIARRGGPVKSYQNGTGVDKDQGVVVNALSSNPNHLMYPAKTEQEKQEAKQFARNQGFRPPATAINPGGITDPRLSEEENRMQITDANMQFGKKSSGISNVSNWGAALIGTDRNAGAIGNPNQAAGVMDAFGKLQGKTPTQVKAGEIYQSNVDSINRRGRDITVYGQEGTSAGVTGNEDPTAQMKLNSLGTPGADPFGKISQGLKMAGDIYASGASGYSGGAGPGWSKFLGGGEMGSLDADSIQKGIGMAGKFFKKSGGHVPKMSYDLGGGVGSSIGSFYGGVNAAFLDVRDKKHKSGGHSYKQGAHVEKEGTTILPMTPQGALDVPEGFQGYFPIPGGEESSHERGGIPMITPAEGKGKQEIEVEGGEGADVSNGETFIIPKGKMKRKYEKVKEKQSRIAKLLQENEIQRDNKQKKFDDIELQTLEKKLNNAKIEENALREEIIANKKAKEAKELQQLQQGPGGQLFAGIMGQQGMNPQMMDEGAEVKKLEEQGLIPSAAYLSTYAEGRRNTKDWYDRVNTGDLKPTNYYDGILQKSITYLQDALDKRLPASQRHMEANLQKQINAANQGVQENANSAGIMDARLRKNWAVGGDKMAGIGDAYGKLGLQYEDKIAGLIGEQDKIERTAQEKQLEAKRTDWGDYRTAMAEDIDELAPILSNLQKNRMQAAINERLAEEFGDSGRGTLPGTIDKKNLQNDEDNEEVVEETTETEFSKDENNNGIPDYLEMIGTDAVIQEEETTLTEEEEEERRRAIEEEVFNTSAEGKEINEKADEAAAIEREILKDKYGIESDEWKRAVGDVPVPGEEDYLGISDDELIREQTEQEKIQSFLDKEERDSEEEVRSINEDLNQDLYPFDPDSNLTEEQKQQKAEEENMKAAESLFKTEKEDFVEIDKLESEGGDTSLQPDVVLNDLNKELEEENQTIKQDEEDKIVDFLQDFETTEGGVEQNEEGEWVTTGLSQYEGEEGKKTIRKYLGKDFIRTDRNGRKKYGIKHYVPEFDDLDYNTKGLLAEYNLNQSWDPRVLILMSTGKLPRSERGWYHKLANLEELDELWENSKEDALEALKNPETLAKLVEERNIIIDGTFAKEENASAMIKARKKSRIYPSTGLRKTHFTGK